MSFDCSATPSARSITGRVEIVEAGENCVFVKAKGTFRGKASGAEVDVPPYAQIIEFRDDLIARVENYSDIDAALRAAGVARSYLVHDFGEPRLGAVDSRGPGAWRLTARPSGP
jgi:hypothetical protein